MEPTPEREKKVVLSGRWLYDELVWRPVHIVRTNFDPWYDLMEADGDLEPGDSPRLNEDGYRYDVFYGDIDAEPLGLWALRDTGGLSLEEARVAVEEELPSLVVWDAMEDGAGVWE